MMGGYIEDKWVYGYDTKLKLLLLLLDKMLIIKLKKKISYI